MKKEEFLKLLYEKLIERGVDREIAERETSHVRTYLTESGTEELNVSLDEMADGIVSMIDSGKEKKAGAKRVAVPIVPKTKEKGKESVSDELGAAIESVDNKPRRTPSVTEEKTIRNEKKEKPPKEKNKKEPVDKKAEKEKKTETKGEGEEKRSLLYRIMARVDNLIKGMKKSKVEKSAQNEKPSKTEKTPKKEKQIKRTDDGSLEEYTPYDKKLKDQYETDGKMKNEWLYITILVIAIPIAIALILIAIVLYIGFWIALALAMIACIAILVVFVTAGSIVAIVGIVYGVVELITGNTPVGLFEVGLGIIVGAAVMFIGILIYNFAVRFIPFGMRLLAKLFKLGFRGLSTGYNMLKGAVANL